MNIDSNFDFSLQRALDGSRYVRQLLDGDSDLLPWLREHYATPCNAGEMAAWLDALDTASEAALAKALRILRKRVMLKLLTRDLGGLGNLNEVMHAMTALAELSVRRAQQFLVQDLSGQFGTPIGAASGIRQEMLVIGMGKLGGGELNVSSDIDLIFVFPEDGETDGPRTISNHDFFNRLGRRLIGLISERTGDGYVFRVDMRLRPYGDSGPLTMSFAALEEYLVQQGREWERYAWIKARVISPAEPIHARELMRLVRPFVFRKYLDFGAFESMRNLHAQIRQEVHRRDRINNIKLGPGGIREIEFIAQVFQLIRGGRDASLRILPTQQVLHRLAAIGQLSADVAEQLDAAYVFLRNLEHRLQYLEDQQTQDIPDNEDDRARIAAAMGFADYVTLLHHLNVHRARVSAQFERIFSTQRTTTEEDTLWRSRLPQAELENELAALGYANAAELAERLHAIRHSARYRQLPESSRRRFDQLVPKFIALCAAPGYHAQTLPRLLDILESISRRAVYLSFLTEYPQVLERLAKIASASAWASGYLVRHPILLDELLDAREIYQPPDWPALDAELTTQLQEHEHDVERQIDALLQFRHSQTFRLLAMDLQNLLPLEILSDHLSDLADLILRHVLRLCWREARKKHRDEPRYAIIAYGKLGGRELGYESDLDLIFLYDDPHPDAAEIYARLTKSINTMLSSYTPGGRLYETDLRLRPNGASGLLVSSMQAFEVYQHENAWVWEHQALTRARYCAGDAEVGKEFKRIRIEVLRQQRDPAKLREEILAMRKKMHDGHPNNGSLFDIKHDSGGMVDIEFIVQYLVLAHAAEHAELTDNRGNLALLTLAGKLGLIDTDIAAKICDIYRALRTLQHKMRLNQDGPCRIEPGEIDTTPVTDLWRQLFKIK